MAHTIRDKKGNTHRYERLLLATGGTPRRLSIPGGDLEGISYYRTLEHYRRLRGEAVEGKSALVIGGGFIGSEIAAIMMEECFDWLDAPVKRVSGKDVPLPYAANLERLAVPEVEDIVVAAREIVYR